MSDTSAPFTVRERLYWISIEEIEFPFDFSMSTIHSFADKAGWRRETVDSIVSRLTANPTMEDSLAIYDMALIRGMLQVKWDATRQGAKPDHGALMSHYYIIFKALVHSIEMFFQHNGIAVEKSIAADDSKK
jgi:hypothetical protein